MKLWIIGSLFLIVIISAIAYSQLANQQEGPIPDIKSKIAKILIDNLVDYVIANIDEDKIVQQIMDNIDEDEIVQQVLDNIDKDKIIQQLVDKIEE